MSVNLLREGKTPLRAAYGTTMREGLFRDQEQHLEGWRHILDFVSDGILVTDNTGRVVMINRNHALLEFATPDEIIGKTIPELVDQGYYVELKPMELEELKELLLTKQPVNFEMITRLRRRLFITTNPILDSQGEIVNIVYTSRDVTEFQKLRHELEKEESLRKLYQSQIMHETDETVFSFKSDAMKKVFDIMIKVSRVDSSVLLSGESGVGKGVVARRIHDLGPRSQHPFIQVNCAAIPESLFEAEVFGYEEGAFTGARKQGKPGLMELAGDGTLFLDEIADLPLALQAKLLQVLQEGEFRRVGGTMPIKLRARVISATNRDVHELLRQNSFREDLFYRLCVIPIHIPPLNERREDILPLADLFLQRFNQRYNLNKSLDGPVRDWLYRYDWPGNVRELQNMIERMAIISEGDVIRRGDIPQPQEARTEKKEMLALEGGMSLKDANEKMEKLLIERVARNYRNSREAAVALGISQATFLRKAHKYGLINSTPKPDSQAEEN